MIVEIIKEYIKDTKIEIVAVTRKHSKFMNDDIWHENSKVRWGEKGQEVSYYTTKTYQTMQPYNCIYIII